MHDETESSRIANELKMLKHMADVAKKVEHVGTDFTRLATDIFTVNGPAGLHHCIASIPQGNSLRKLQELFP